MTSWSLCSWLRCYAILFFCSKLETCTYDVLQLRYHPLTRPRCNTVLGNGTFSSRHWVFIIPSKNLQTHVTYNSLSEWCFPNQTPFNSCNTHTNTHMYSSQKISKLVKINTWPFKKDSFLNCALPDNALRVVCIYVKLRVSGQKFDRGCKAKLRKDKVRDVWNKTSRGILEEKTTWEVWIRDFTCVFNLMLEESGFMMKIEVVISTVTQENHERKISRFFWFFPS